MKVLPLLITKELVNLVLRRPPDTARQDLYLALIQANSNEGQFYEGIIYHRRGLQLTTDEWFDLLTRLPNRFLRSGLDLNGLLSEEQLRRLPPVTG
jgi:hypothetical protein